MSYGTYTYNEYAYFYANAVVKELVSRGYVLHTAEYHFYHDKQAMVMNMVVDLGTGTYSETFNLTDVILSYGADLWGEFIRVAADDVIRGLQQGGNGVPAPTRAALCLP